MPSIDKKKVDKRLFELTAAIGEYGEDPENGDLFRQILKRVDELSQATPWADFDVSDFFREVGAGMIAAQRQLDDGSRCYCFAMGSDACRRGSGRSRRASVASGLLPSDRRDRRLRRALPQVRDRRAL